MKVEREWVALIVAREVTWLALWAGLILLRDRSSELKGTRNSEKWSNDIMKKLTNMVE